MLLSIQHHCAALTHPDHSSLRPSIQPEGSLSSFIQQVPSQALESWAVGTKCPQRTQAHPCLPTPTPNSLSRGVEKRFGRKDSHSLRVDSHSLPPCWPQPGCAPSRQLLVKVFKQCRRPLVALKAAGLSVTLCCCCCYISLHVAHPTAPVPLFLLSLHSATPHSTKPHKHFKNQEPMP